MQDIYLEMPVSVEQKRKYNLLGYRVVDVKFAPEGYELPDMPEEVEEPEQPRRRRTRAEE